MTFPRNTVGFQNPSEIISSLVVIYGSGVTGLFVYSGIPGPGNGPIAFVQPAGVGVDPYGNSLVNSGGFTSIASGVTGGLWSTLQQGVVLFGDTLAGSTLLANGSMAIFHTAHATDEPILQIASPAADATNITQSIIQMLGGPGSGAANPQILAYAFEDASSTQVPLQGFYLWGPLNFISNFTRSPYVITQAAQLVGSSGDLTVNSLDNNPYDTEANRQTFENLPISAVTPSLSNIGPAFNVAAHQYIIHVRFAYTEAAGGIPRFGFTTTATNNASFTNMDMSANQNNGGGQWAGIQAAPLNPTAFVAGKTMAGGSAWMVDLWLRVVFTSTGTIQFGGNTSVAADNYSIEFGHITLYPATVPA